MHADFEGQTQGFAGADEGVGLAGRAAPVSDDHSQRIDWVNWQVKMELNLDANEIRTQLNSIASLFQEKNLHSLR